MGLRVKGAKPAKLNAKALEVKKDIQSKMNKANKRIKRLEQSGLAKTSHAYRVHVKDKGNFGIKGKGHNALLAEQKRINQFLEAQTSTNKGVKKNTENMLKLFNREPTHANIQEFNDNADKIFALVHRAQEHARMMGENSEELSSSQIMDVVGEKMNLGEFDFVNPDNSLESIIDTLMERLEQAAMDSILGREASAMNKLMKSKSGKLIKKMPKLLIF